MKDRLAERDRLLSQSAGNQPAPMARTPYFCSGCPHNTSTRVPAGSRAGAGIGCPYMSQCVDRNTAAFTHMAAPGANLPAPPHCAKTKHMFHNLGDGTPEKSTRHETS